MIDDDYTDRTIAVVGKIINVPELTNKSLQRPPYRYLFQIIMNIQGKTGFAKGLFTDAELDTGNPPPADNKKAHPEDRNERISFLQKCGDISELALQKPCPINPRETVAGRSPMETNRMLVMFAHSALKYGANCDQFVKKVLAKHAAGSVSDSRPSSRRISVTEQQPPSPSPANTTSHSNPSSRPGSMRYPPTSSHPDLPSRPGSMRYPPSSSSSSATGENSSSPFAQAKSGRGNPSSDQARSSRGNPSSDEARSTRGSLSYDQANSARGNPSSDQANYSARRNPSSDQANSARGNPSSSDQAKSARRNSSYDQTQSAPGNPPSAPSNSTTSSSSRRSSTDSASARPPSEGQDGFVVAVDQASIFKTETTSEPTDSYVRLTYGKTSVNTGVVHFSSKPVYGAEFSFDYNAAAKSKLTVELWEANQVMGDTILAVGVVEEIGRSKELAVHLKDKDSGVSVSDVFLRVATL